MQCLSLLKENLTLHFNEFHLRILRVKFVDGTGSVVLNKVFQNQCVLIFSSLFSPAEMLVPKFYTFQTRVLCANEVRLELVLRFSETFSRLSMHKFRIFCN